jgi:ABC-type phosphate/phosphonate transport system substrate-binding protein
LRHAGRAAHRPGDRVGHPVRRHRRAACRREARLLLGLLGVKEDSPIKTIADLRGKTVGISIINGGTQGPFNLLLKKAGLDPEKDIKLVEVTFPLAEDALRQGRVDAVNMNQPFAARAEGKGGTRKLFSLSERCPTSSTSWKRAGRTSSRRSRTSPGCT